MKRFFGLVAATLVSGVLLVALAPDGKQLDSLWLFLAYLLPFVLATETIAALEPEWLRRWRLPEVVGVLTFTAVFCGFVPRMFDRVIADDFEGFYSLVRVLAPLLILAFALHQRLGGSASATVRRICYASILVMLSGLEDLSFWLWRGQPVPQRWDWADHMTVRLGHVASRTEAYVFIAAHLVAAVAVLCWPSPPRLVGPPAGAAPAGRDTARGGGFLADRS
ncbi:hypothetical protein AB0J72_05540 [Dactylosporangium sp. NPDC049742]|uniref:hypothetical protein n=1 Tax=Dactylosporangium sp. NPDC049742 TaxID=3154737 RepID=UPI0034495D3C